MQEKEFYNNNIRILMYISLFLFLIFAWYQYTYDLDLKDTLYGFSPHEWLATKNLEINKLGYSNGLEIYFSSFFMYIYIFFYDILHIDGLVAEKMIIFLEIFSKIISAYIIVNVIFNDEEPLKKDFIFIVFSLFCISGYAFYSDLSRFGEHYYAGLSGTEYIMSICDTKIFKSDSMDGTMDDISAALTITYNQNNIWTFSILNDLAIFVGGAPNAPIRWDGSGNAEVLGGSPPSGNFGFSTHDRMFIGNTAASPSILYWSILSNCEDWSGTGSGNTTIVTNDGDELICGVPINNDLTLLFKQYSIHHMGTNSAPFPIKPLVQGVGCCGKLAAVNVNGLIYFISKEPRMYVTDGYTITKMSDKIDDLWDDLNKSRLKYIQGIYFPVLNQIHWYCSMGSATVNNYCLIWDLENKCWLRYTTSADVNVACIASGYRLFCGAYDGKIYEKEYASTYVDASETAPGIINAYWKSPHINLKNNISVKQSRFVNVSYKTQTSGVIKYYYGYDFGLQNSGSLSQLQSGGKWGVDLWDSSFIWGGQADSQSNFFTFGRGNNIQIKLGNDNEDETISINSATLALKEQGIKEFAAK